MDLLPLGTVIQLDNHKFFIIGYSSIEKEQTKLHGYFVTAYPLGFTSIEKIVFIPHNYAFSVVAEGYKTKASERLLNTLSKSLETVENVSYDEIMRLNHFLAGDISATKGELVE